MQHNKFYMELTREHLTKELMEWVEAFKHLNFKPFQIYF